MFFSGKARKNGRGNRIFFGLFGEKRGKSGKKCFLIVRLVWSLFACMSICGNRGAEFGVYGFFITYIVKYIMILYKGLKRAEKRV